MLGRDFDLARRLRLPAPGRALLLGPGIGHAHVRLHQRAVDARLDRLGDQVAAGRPRVRELRLHHDLAAGDRLAGPGRGRAQVYARLVLGDDDLGLRHRRRHVDVGVGDEGFGPHFHDVVVGHLGIVLRDLGDDGVLVLDDLNIAGEAGHHGLGAQLDDTVHFAAGVQLHLRRRR